MQRRNIRAHVVEETCQHQQSLHRPLLEFVYVRIIKVSFVSMFLQNQQNLLEHFLTKPRVRTFISIQKIHQCNHRLSSNPDIYVADGWTEKENVHSSSFHGCFLQSQKM